MTFNLRPHTFMFGFWYLFGQIIAQPHNSSRNHHKTILKLLQTPKMLLYNRYVFKIGKRQLTFSKRLGRQFISLKKFI